MTDPAHPWRRLERCPGCRARLGDASTCPRCGCDLSLVRRAETQALALARQALRAWAADDPRTALAAAARSLSLQHNPLASAVMRLARPQPAPSHNPPADHGAGTQP